MAEEEKLVDKNDIVLIVFFADEKAAESAIEGLKVWDKSYDHIKLGAIGTLSKDGDKIKMHVGRKTGKGAAIGAAVGVIGAVLTGGASLIVTTIGAGAVGGVLGAFFKKSPNLTKEEIDSIGAELDAGRVAVVVNLDEYEVPMVTEYMVGSQATVRTYNVPQAALAEVASSPEVMDMVSEGQA